MPKEKKPEEKPAGCPGWMLTFGDCMSLLMTFFVMIVSFTTFDDMKMEKVLGSLNRSLGLLTTDRAAIFSKSMRKTLQGQETGTKEKMENPNLLSFGYKKEDTEIEKSLILTSDLKEKLRGQGLYEMIDIVPLLHGVSIRIQNAILFDSGSAQLKPEAENALDYFIRLLSSLPHEIIVEGHTDSNKIRSSRFPSNWELSAARAAAVVNYFITKKIAAERFVVKAMADTKPLVMPASKTENQRVELLIKGLKLGEVPDYVRQEKERR